MSNRFLLQAGIPLVCLWMGDWLHTPSERHEAKHADGFVPVHGAVILLVSERAHPRSPGLAQGVVPEPSEHPRQEFRGRSIEES